MIIFLQHYKFFKSMLLKSGIVFVLTPLLLDVCVVSGFFFFYYNNALMTIFIHKSSSGKSMSIFLVHIFESRNISSVGVILCVFLYVCIYVQIDFLHF